MVDWTIAVLCAVTVMISCYLYDGNRGFSKDQKFSFKLVFREPPVSIILEPAENRSLLVYLYVMYLRPYPMNLSS